MPRASTSPPRRAVDRYEIVEALGTDSVATQYLGRLDTSETTPDWMPWILVTRIHEDVANEPRAEKFAEEAKLALRMNVPNVVTVFDVRRHEGTLWLVTEYVHGGTFADLERAIAAGRSSLPLATACRLVAGAARGLHAIHEFHSADGQPLHLVHRDVRPRSLIAGFDGVPRVADLGMARFSALPSTLPALAERLPYLSPEQVAGDPLDRATDIFSLAVVLWELLTGRRLFAAETNIATLASIQTCSVPPPSSVRLDLPEALDAALLKGLAKNREDRFATALAFAEALEPFAPPAAEDEDGAVVRAILADEYHEREALMRKLGGRS